VYAIGRRHGKFMCLDGFRRRPMPMNGAAFLVNGGPLILKVYCVDFEATALHTWVGYSEIASGEFLWRSKDGIGQIINVAPFTGGTLTATVSGQGTLIVPLAVSDPGFATVYLADEDT